MGPNGEHKELSSMLKFWRRVICVKTLNCTEWSVKGQGVVQNIGGTSWRRGFLSCGSSPWICRSFGTLTVLLKSVSENQGWPNAFVFRFPPDMYPEIAFGVQCAATMAHNLRWPWRHLDGSDSADIRIPSGHILLHIFPIAAAWIFTSCNWEIQLRVQKFRMSWSWTCFKAAGSCTPNQQAIKGVAWVLRDWLGRWEVHWFRNQPRDVCLWGCGGVGGATGCGRGRFCRVAWTFLSKQH